MTGAEFQSLLDADPFEPFTVHLTGGSSCDVFRPDGAVVKSGGTARIEMPGTNGLYSLIALQHVVRIEYVTPTVIR